MGIAPSEGGIHNPIDDSDGLEIAGKRRRFDEARKMAEESSLASFEMQLQGVQGTAGYRAAKAQGRGGRSWVCNQSNAHRGSDRRPERQNGHGDDAGDHSGLSAEILGIGTNSPDCFRYRLEQKVVNDGLVLERKGGNGCQNREHAVEVIDQVGSPVSKPLGPGQTLTLGAVSITAANGELTISCLMGKFRNGESTIDSVAKLTVFPVILCRSIRALLSITMVNRRDPRSERSCS
jgi:hypothetical protein